MNERTLERLDFSIDPFTVTEKDSFCPRDVKERTLGSTLISSAFGAPITLALYVDVGDPTPIENAPNGLIWMLGGNHKGWLV